MDPTQNNGRGEARDVRRVACLVFQVDKHTSAGLSHPSRRFPIVAKRSRQQALAAPLDERASPVGTGRRPAQPRHMQLPHIRSHAHACSDASNA